jgi:transcriptional regulator with XRE-family HTH domain
MQSSVRPHKSLTERARILASYERSGLTQQEVAAQHGIALSTLQRWLQQSRAGRPTGGPDLLELPNLFGASGAGSPYRLRFPRGVILEVAPGFQPGEVRALAQLLQSL